jgi:hypothetical protein
MAGNRRREVLGIGGAMVCLTVAGCALSIVPQGERDAPVATDEGVLVFGRITYVVDGVIRLPYGAFRPSIQPPFLDLFQLDSGNPLQTHAAGSVDGSYVWRMRPGHYVISGIGQGQYTDDYRITWPRLAFQVKAGGAANYLGHLQLRGKRYAEPYTLSTGTQGVSRGIRYEFIIEDEADRGGAPAGIPLQQSLIFHRANMPIGESLVNRWRVSKDGIIREIFGP